MQAMDDSTSQPQTKQCPKCETEYPATLEFFYAKKDSKHGLGSWCRACILQKAREKAPIEYREKEAQKNLLAQQGLKMCSRCEGVYLATPENFSRTKRLKDGFDPWCKACAKKYNHQWRDAHPTYDCEYDKTHKEQRLAYEKTYRITHREQQTLRWRARHHANKLARNAYSRQYNKINRDRLREYERQYRLQNPDKLKTKSHRRNTIKKALPVSFTAMDWRFALEYFGGRCAVCGRQQGLWHTLAMDHWIPLSSLDCPGTIPTNIVPLCHGQDGCNNSKNNHDPREWVINTFGARRGKQILARIEAYFASFEVQS